MYAMNSYRIFNDGSHWPMDGSKVAQYLDLSYVQNNGLTLAILWLWSGIVGRGGIHKYKYLGQPMGMNRQLPNTATSRQKKTVNNQHQTRVAWPRNWTLS